MLGPYEILAPVGTGGMGEVYRARDRRLGREVAVKVLGSEVASTPEMRARFQREARSISALSHPNICPLFDVGQQDDHDFIVMEYLEGQTLAERLARLRAGGSEGLPIEEAVRIAGEVARALAHAHRHGIVHRDLKPGNVMLTSTGSRLLDFGLAKQQAPAGSTSPVPSAEDTRSVSLTGPTQLLGTPLYMAPEQVEGRAIDARTDVFAFGSVLYEMLTGRRAFDADSTAGVIAAVLTGEPPRVRELRPEVPESLERLVNQCLAKDPPDRWQSARDIELYLASLADLAYRDPTGKRRISSGLIAGALAAGAILGMVAAGLFWRPGRAAPGPAAVAALSIALPAHAKLVPNDRPGGGSSLAISRDGRRLAYVSLRNGTSRLILRTLDRAEEVEVAGSEGALSPFFSPDGAWVAFFNGIDLKKAPVSGGTPMKICKAPPVPRGGAWAEDGTIYFSPNFSRGLQRVSSDGGVPQDVTQVDFASGESNHLLPELLPGGEVLLYTSWTGGDFDSASVWSLSLRTGARRRLIVSAAAARYVAPGYLVFSRGGSLLAVPFDAERLEAGGSAVPVLEGVWNDPSTGTAHYAIAQNGTLVYAHQLSNAAPNRLVWVDRLGRIEPWPTEAGFYTDVRFSPDGRRVAVRNRNDIWLYDLAGRTMSRVTHRGVNQFPVWTPDGRHITFSSSQGVPEPKLAWSDLSRDGGTELLTRDGGAQFPSSWSPDRKVLAYSEISDSDTNDPTDFDVWLMNPEDRAARAALIRTEAKEDQATFSTDGLALAYVSDETGRLEVYLRATDAAGRKIQVSAGGGTEPVWSRKGGELFFRNGRRYFSVRVTTRTPMAVGAAQLLFEGSFVVDSATPGNPSYDVAPDGRRFVMVTSEGEASWPSHIEVVLNWIEKLKSLGSARR